MTRPTVLTGILVMTLVGVVGCGSGSGEAPAAATTTSSTVPELDLAAVASEFNASCEAASEEADPGDTYMLGDLAIADATSIAFDLNSRSTTLCAEMLGNEITNTFGFSQSTIGRIESTRALDGELDATSADGQWQAFWRYHPDNGLDITIEKAAGS